MTAGGATEREATTTRGRAPGAVASHRRPVGDRALHRSMSASRAGGLVGLGGGHATARTLQSEPAGQEPAAARPARRFRGRPGKPPRPSGQLHGGHPPAPARRAAPHPGRERPRPASCSRPTLATFTPWRPRNSSSRAPAEHADLAPRQPRREEESCDNGVELPAGDPGAEAAEHGGVLAPVFGLREVSARRRVDRPAVERGGASRNEGTGQCTAVAVGRYSTLRR